MISKLFPTLLLGSLLAYWEGGGELFAAEFRGAIETGGLPVPGATLTATQGHQQLASSTDERGVFSFGDLADGVWKVQITMLGFEKMTREVVLSPNAPAAIFELKLLTQQAVMSGLGVPEASARPRPAATRAGFQQVDVNQSASTASFGNNGAMKTEEVSSLNQSAANSFLVQGSMSSALGLPRQNDWGPGGPGGMPGGMSGGMPGQGGPNGDGPGNSPQGDGRMMAGGMRGGPSGGGPGGGGPGGGGPGGGGPGGGGPGGMGFGGPGGPGGRPPWEGRPGAMAFGNNRRDPRNMYMASAFFSLDNSALDARSFSVTGADVGKPSYANARAGVSIGGPLFIPKLISKDRHILFSLDIQFQRNRTGSVSDAVNVPTALERLGDFSQTSLQGSPVVVYDPATGAPFAGNKIPTSRLSSTALGLLQYYPLPNLNASTLNYETTLNGHSNMHNINARLSNIKLDSADRLNFGIGYQGSDSATPNLFQFTDTGSGRGLNTNAGWSRTISTHLTNTVQFSFSRNRQESLPYFADKQNIAAALGIAGTSQSAVNWGPPSIGLTNYARLTDGTYSLARNQTGSGGESLLWIHGTHTYTFGGDYRRMQFNQYADSNGRGSYSFNGSATSLLIGGIAQSGTGSDLADLLLGMPTTSFVRYGSPDKYLRGSGYDFFVNDDWRLRPGLSINFGIRYDYTTPVAELYDRLVNLDIASGYTAITPVVAPSALINPDRNNFSPRLGIAWRPRTRHSLVVRSGYGVYYNTSVYNVIAGNMAQQPPFAQSLSVSSSAASLVNINTAFLAATTNAATSTYAVDPNYRIGYAQTWTVSLQNDLPFSMFGTLGYLGTKGTRLDQQFIPNSVAPGAVVSAYPHSFIYETSNGNSISHALQTQLNRRFHNGIMWRASYQFSKSIDDAGTGGRGQGNTPVAQNWLDLSGERGLSSFDSRNNLSVSLQYSTGMGTQGGTLLNGWKGALLKDWTFGSDISLRSGNPFTATVGGNLSQVAGTAVSNTVRAEATGQSIAGGLFNTAAFALPLAGTWGNAGRNTIPGPTAFYLNSSFGRVFRFGERRSVDVQIQSQNLLNHVTINSWGTVLGASNYGIATNAAAMRKITFNLRFRF